MHEQVYETLEYTIVGSQMYLPHIHAHRHGNATCQVIQKTYTVDSFERNAYQERLVCRRFPLRHNDPVAVFGGYILCHASGLLMHGDAAVRCQETHNRIARNRVAT